MSNELKNENTNFQDGWGESMEDSFSDGEQEVLYEVRESIRLRKQQEEARDRFRQNLLLFNMDSRELDKSSFDDYFRDERYTELKAVAYVASPTFFCRHASHFEDVEMVMGINDSEL